MKPLPKAFQLGHPRYEIRDRLARWFAAAHGDKGTSSGWIRDSAGRVLAQGWSEYYLRHRAAIWSAVYGEK